MSVEAMTWAFAQPLPPCPKSVLVALANRADEDGFCWPGIDDLERRTGWKRRAVQTAIKDLQARQLLTVSPQFSDKTGVQKSNLYRIALSQAPAPISRGEGAPDAPYRAGHAPSQGAPPAPLRVHQVRGEGAPPAPESSSEQSVEQSRVRSASSNPTPPTAPGGGVPATGPDAKTTGKPRGHRASIFPDGWEVEPWMEELCKGFGLNPHAEFRDFKNNHKAKGTLFVSWPHAFRTWVTRSVKFQQQRRG